MQAVTTGHDPTPLRKNTNVLALTDHNSLVTIHQGKEGENPGREVPDPHLTHRPQQGSLVWFELSHPVDSAVLLAVKMF